MTWRERIGLGVVGLALLALLVGVAYEQWSRRQVDRDFPPPGRMVEVDGHRMHVRCEGEGRPTLILEAGLGIDASTSWDPVFDDLASVTRTCAYDRAGLPWSEPGPRPRTAERITDELHALLGVAGESPPYVLVGHSMGGPLVLTLADRHPDEVVGMVLVDSSHPEQIDRSPAVIGELQDSMLPSPWLARVLSATGILRVTTSKQRAGGGDGAPRPMQLKLAQPFPAMIDEAKSLAVIFAEAQEVSDLGDLPLVVLGAGGRPGPGVFAPQLSEAVVDEMFRVHDILQAELAELSTRADLRVIEDAQHYIHRDRPDVVIAAVTERVEAARSEAAR